MAPLANQFECKTQNKADQIQTKQSSNKNNSGFCSLANSSVVVIEFRGQLTQSSCFADGEIEDQRRVIGVDFTFFFSFQFIFLILVLFACPPFSIGRAWLCCTFSLLFTSKLNELAVTLGLRFWNLWAMHMEEAAFPFSCGATLVCGMDWTEDSPM